MFASSKTLRTFIALGTLSLLSGCLQSLPSKTSSTSAQPTQTAEQLLAQAQQQAPASASSSRLEAADLFSLQGQPIQAKQALSLVDPTLLTSEQQLLLQLISAELALNEQRTEQAHRALQAAKSAAAIPEQLAQRFSLAEANLLEQQKQPEQALQLRLALNQGLDTPYLAQHNREAIWRLVNQLPLASFTSANPELQQWVELAKLVRQPAPLNMQQQAIEAWQQNHPQHPASLYPPQAITHLLSLSNHQLQHIGLVLPSSGPFAVPAQAIREGFVSAQAQDGSEAPFISFYDSTQLTNLDAFYQTAKTDGVELLVGPWERELISQIGNKTTFAIPTLALNYLPATEPSINPNLYQFGISPEDEARQVALQAANEGLTKAAIISLPDHPLSQRATAAFTHTFQQMGGSITQTIQLAPGNPLQQIITKQLASDQEAEFVFLQTSPPLAKRLLPFIQRDDLPLPVYAISVAISDFNQDPSAELNGVRFTEIPWFIEDSALKNDIIQKWPAAKGNMGRFYAFGADAYQLAKRYQQFSNIAHTQINGLTGILSLNNKRQVERYTDWVELQDGKLIELPNYATP